jgi:apolipoprotein N-acyltransferase
VVAVGSLVALGALTVVPALAPYTPSVDDHTTIAAVQGNVPGNGDNILLDYRQVTDNHVQATIDLAGDVAAGRTPRPDFVIWPENSTAVDPFADAQTAAGIRAASTAIGVPLLVGAMVDAGPEHVLNQGIVWDPATGAGDRYSKWHPVPYGEYIPFRRFFSGNFGRLALIPRDMLSGTRSEPLSIAGVQVADAICFDVAYDDVLDAQVRNGGQLVTVQTSNASFVGTAQIAQQFAITRVRAIETGRYAVVAALDGISGVIAPDGRVLAAAPVRTKAVLQRDVGLISGSTPAVVLGSRPGQVAAGLVLARLIGSCIIHRRRRRHPAREH